MFFIFYRNAFICWNKFQLYNICRSYGTLLFVLLFLQTFRSYGTFHFQIFKLAHFQIKLPLQYGNSYDLYFV